MTGDEVTAMLAAARKVQLATINPDGTPHLVAMYYVLISGRITFWTYRSSQKARNLARDPRVTCLVESGEQYFDLRGVQVRGTAELIADPAAVGEIGRRVAAGMPGVPAGTPGGAPGTGALEAYVEHAARKRVGFSVWPDRIISWDHSRLPGAAG
ncbi:MAG TPA: pyridoxamine 5'-phosphate oxidase family protein [Streptosporangiaceae bacterium]|nr:pyridoxamine 5'-phosphate oxidase family protein [Streptosporangiaceae bacterium]